MLDCQLSIDSVYEEKDPKFIFINCCRFSFIQKIRIHKNDRFESDFDFHERKTHSFCFREVNCEIKRCDNTRITWNALSWFNINLRGDETNEICIKYKI